MKLKSLIAGTALACAFASLVYAAGGDPLAPIGLTDKQPVAPVTPVTETLYGTQITDNYRYMEKMDPDTIAYMKAQGAYTRKIFDAVAPRAGLLKRIADFSGGFGFIEGYQKFGGREFYEYRAPGSDNFDLMVRDAKGERKVIDVAALREKNGGKPYAINYFQPSPDGSKFAVGISEGGSEAAAISVYDAGTGAQIAEPLDRAEFGIVTWSDNSKTVYFSRLKQLAPGEPAVDKYKDSAMYAWNMKTEPKAVFGTPSGHGPAFKPDENPALGISPGAPMAVGLNINGVQPEFEIWLAPKTKLEDSRVVWRELAARDDGVTNLDLRGNEIFLLSHKDAPTFKVLSVKANAALSTASVLIPAQPDRIIESIHAASDALYVLAREGVYSHLLRVPVGTTTIEDVALPYKGYAAEAFTDPRRPGIIIAEESWVVPPTYFSYDPKTKAFTDLKLGTKPDYDPNQFVVSDLEAKAGDGVMVPETLVESKDAKGPQITMIQAYGSYGISQLPNFSPRSVTFLKEGGTAYVSCHVRGGGELGETWRLSGKDDKKFNTWRDLIACAEDLLARGVTTKDKLFIFGGSAGGITMGMALTERPDLFAGVIDAVPAANTTRSEFSPNGPPNIPEFGTVTNEQGFKNLLAMDSYQHVKDGTQYPAVMVTTGLNDPRVSSWEPAKFAARLQASGTTNPVLLRVEAEAGHGIGSTKSQNDAL
ncbi:MAG TPA: prolyl oligopeptidase family serine peptidase, partial [Rhizomicrobium sp.]|nr:prolyl oligopeptidase family serine peptidase [Rhizomicrobium sp.]